MNTLPSANGITKEKRDMVFQFGAGTRGRGRGEKSTESSEDDTTTKFVSYWRGGVFPVVLVWTGSRQLGEERG